MLNISVNLLAGTLKMESFLILFELIELTKCLPHSFRIEATHRSKYSDKSDHIDFGWTCDETSEHLS